MSTLRKGGRFPPGSHLICYLHRSDIIRTAATWINRAEPYVLALITLAFWYPTPTRTDWLWLLVLVLPLLAARYILYQRLLTRTPFDLLFAAFLVLGALNVYIAPYTRGLMMLARPLLGMLIAYSLVEAARVSGRMRGPLTVTLALALLVGALALGSTQWNSKSNQLQPLVDVLPTIAGFPGAERGFNSNEIAGALAWLTPLMAGLAVRGWRRQGPQKWWYTAAFLMLFWALFLGQSRMALAGVLLALGVIIALLLPGYRARVVAGAALAAVIVLEALIVTGQFSLVAGADVSQAVTERNELSSQGRFAIWASGLAIVRDYPLQGVGLSMFRDGRVREAYPVDWIDPYPPHTHNELLQVATDMGLPGLLVFVGLHVVAGVMIWYCWRQGDADAAAVAIAVGAGLLAHAVYGLGDAITLWDRFAFIFWWLLGLLAAQYTLTRQQTLTKAATQS